MNVIESNTIFECSGGNKVQINNVQVCCESIETPTVLRSEWPILWVILFYYSVRFLGDYMWEGGSKTALAFCPTCGNRGFSECRTEWPRGHGVCTKYVANRRVKIVFFCFVLFFQISCMSCVLGLVYCQISFTLGSPKDSIRESWDWSTLWLKCSLSKAQCVI